MARVSAENISVTSPSSRCKVQRTSNGRGTEPHFHDFEEGTSVPFTTRFGPPPAIGGKGLLGSFALVVAPFVVDLEEGFAATFTVSVELVGDTFFVVIEGMGGNLLIVFVDAILVLVTPFSFSPLAVREVGSALAFPLSFVKARDFLIAVSSLVVRRALAVG